MREAPRLCKAKRRAMPHRVYRADHTYREIQKMFGTALSLLGGIGDAVELDRMYAINVDGSSLGDAHPPSEAVFQPIFERGRLDLESFVTELLPISRVADDLRSAGVNSKMARGSSVRRPLMRKHHPPRDPHAGAACSAPRTSPGGCRAVLNEL
jgi:hypothetical protein